MKKIKELRLKNCFTQEQMAEALFTSQNAYSLIESGKSPLLDHSRIKIIAEKFNLHPLELGVFDCLGITEHLMDKSQTRDFLNSSADVKSAGEETLSYLKIE